MTLRLDFAVLADYALVDQQGKLSVLGIFQHVWVADFPTVHPRTHLVHPGARAADRHRDPRASGSASWTRTTPSSSAAREASSSASPRPG